jgi:hypothetical protein
MARIIGGIDRVERCNRLHKHWLSYQGMGMRGPRHNASRHVTHFNWENFVNMNDPSRDFLTRNLAEYAMSKGVLEKIRDIHTDAGGDSTRKGVVGGSAKFTFLNAHMHNASVLKGPMNEAETINERCRAITDWELNYRNHEERYLAWYWQYRKELEERRQKKIMDQVAEELMPVEPEVQFESPWGSGVDDLPTDPSNVESDLHYGSRTDNIRLRTNPRCEEMRREERYLCRGADAIGVRLKELDDDTDYGCLELTRNVCRTINMHRLAQIETW